MRGWFGFGRLADYTVGTVIVVVQLILAGRQGAHLADGAVPRQLPARA